MIAHGNKQISEIVYARKASEGGGAVRLTNIIRGAQVVFGGLYPLWRLTDAAKAAILAAFGKTDGYAVIKATNAYLNALAATDPTKASALAGFINEDPMLVCSLGLQPQGVEMPIRGLVNDGVAYINLGVKPNSKTILEVRYARLTTSYSSCGARVAFGNSAFSIHAGDNIQFNTQNSNIETGIEASIGIYYTYKLDAVNRKAFLNNIVFNTDAISGNNYNIWLFANDNAGSLHNPNKASYAFAKLKQGNTELEMYPFIRQGANGMIDTINGVFYPNANTSGSFTIEYTLPDGSPWTPLNQTP